MSQAHADNVHADGSLLESGTPLSTRQQTGVHGGTLAAATTSVIATTTRGDDGLVHATLIRADDGSVVRSLRYDSAATTWKLAGTSVVTVDNTPGGFLGYWTVADATTGTVTSRVSLAGNSRVLDASDQRAVVVAGESERQPNGNLPLDIVRPGSPPLPVLAPDGTRLADDFYAWTAGDARTAYLSAFGHGDLAVDLATGTSTTVSPPSSGGLSLRAVTAHRVYFWGPTIDPTRIDVAWRSRDTNESGSYSVTVPGDDHYRGLMAFGDGLAVRTGSDDDLTVQPISSDGSLEAPVLKHVARTGLLGDADGRLVAIQPGDPVGMVRVVSPGADGANPSTHDLARLPAADARPTSLGLSGALVASAWDDGTVLTSSVRGSGWSPTAPATPAGIGGMTQAGDVLLTRLESTGAASFAYRLSWPGGSRDISSDSSVVLGHGGRYVTYVAARSSSTHAEEARSGSASPAPVWSPDVAHVVDGTTVWVVDGGTRLVGTDLMTGRAVEARDVPASCSTAQVRDVRGRWALLRCGSSEMVIDLDGSAAPWRTPADDVRLGGGFVAWTSQDVPRTDVTTPATRLRVVDLTAEHREHDFGPVRPTSSDTTLVVNDDATPSLVYVDEDGRIRFVDAAWTLPPALDRTPPSLGAVTGTSGVLGTVRGTATFAGAASDAVGVAAYELRSRSALPGSPLGPWTISRMATPPSVVEPVLAGMTRCYSFRAFDAAGNASAWSPPRCTTAPDDDTAWTSTGARARQRDPRAFKGAYSVLRRGRSALTMRNALGGDVIVWALRGPHGGVVRITLGGHVVGSVRLSGRRVAVRRVVLPNPQHWTGDIRFQRRSGTVRLDGGAVAPTPLEAQ